MAKTPLKDHTAGIPDPDRPGRLLVYPWPVQASLSEVVRHFLMAFVGGLQGERSTTRQLAYFEGYQAALDNLGTPPELLDPVRRQWYDELRDDIAYCIALVRQRESATVRQPVAS